MTELPSSPARTEAERLAAAALLDIRSRLPLVPALFTALAADPEALVEAWLQARALYEHPCQEEIAGRLAAAPRVPIPYAPDRTVRDLVLPFAQELPSLLLVASLLLALEGELPRQPLPPLALPEGGQAPVELPERPLLPEHEHPLFAEIRAVYGSERVPSVYRCLAGHGVLEEAWSAVGPYLASPTSQAHASRLSAAARHQALRLPEVVFFSIERARPLLAHFQRALPLNLIFATACASY